MMQRIVNIKAKVSLKSSTMVRDLDIYCLKRYRPSNSTASKLPMQEITAKNFQLKNSQIKKVKPTLSQTAKANKSSEQACKVKMRKKDYKKREKNEQTLINIVNINKVMKKKKIQDCDISKVTYYNCNKKSHNKNACTKL